MDLDNALWSQLYFLERKHNLEMGRLIQNYSNALQGQLQQPGNVHAPTPLTNPTTQIPIIPTHLPSAIRRVIVPEPIVIPRDPLITSYGNDNDNDTVAEESTDEDEQRNKTYCRPTSFSDSSESSESSESSQKSDPSSVESDDGVDRPKKRKMRMRKRKRRLSVQMSDGENRRRRRHILWTPNLIGLMKKKVIDVSREMGVDWREVIKAKHHQRAELVEKVLVLLQENMDICSRQLLYGISKLRK